MKRYNGKSMYKGIAIGKIRFYKKAEVDVSCHEITDVEKEVSRYENARDVAVSQLNKIYEKAVGEIGEETAAIFDVQAMMLSDDDFNDSVYSMIRDDKNNAEYAVFTTGERFAETFSQMDDEYMKARSFDIKDISKRVLDILCGTSDMSDLGDEKVIIASDDLTPAETVLLDKSKLLAFVTKYGSSNSHTAILARTMSIPALTGVIIDAEWDGKMAVVDGFSGELIVEPDVGTLSQCMVRQEAEEKKREILLQLKNAEDVTAGGRHINLFANIGNVNDVENVLNNGAAGIGLFRSEFLYLGRNTYPSEDQQFAAYKNALRKMNGKKVVIRTLDIGADKQAEYFHLEHEENPAMGLRAIRLCLTNTDLFKTQLRALYRASAFGNLSIMYPMITSIEEVHEIKKISASVRAQLNKEGIVYGDVEQGIMIETPAAVMISEDLAKEVDFFSIGTNDLTQYTLAIDRQNSKLDRFYNPHHPAVLKMIEMTIQNGHKHGCWVGICGELGGDLEMTQKFISMGIDELSVSASQILPLRQKIRECK